MGLPTSIISESNRRLIGYWNYSAKSKFNTRRQIYKMKSPIEIKLPELIRRKTNEILSCVKKQKAVYDNYRSLYTCK